ncbi:MAG: ribosome-associated ATPase/putative transporter RbbA [Rhodobacter sp.]|nr:ribosome-associated ATPase/putative transporter RbbA [Rhodobacter sp.]MCA3461749.1 ribosome-associated ATPase/putative transporter RbbA [Rhodobacter sp.]MCA3465367.1 ribosome-associated ATPase/putative transporter RbbA [Rhodobacter sp.]MCA3468151.1 ribosome-associated ATPase/putative transporter RbbA [Rhodobacter sp.]MCA3469429.1 ribosome-associated ATPase/putative transporter RbbA [Rhodobacter sp.]
MPLDASTCVVASSLSHRYGATTALDQVSLTIPTASFTAVVGPDGVGKSTMLGLIAGARALQSGELTVLGARMGDKREREAVFGRIAFMPQGLGRNLYPTLSVMENIDFIGRLHGLDDADRAARIARLTQATGLSPFLDRPAGKLSGGMKQKLSLCAALIHDPDLLILDEPTTGVDPLSRRRFWALIGALHASRPSMTVLVSTAYMEEAERFERLVVMDRGRVLAAGPTREVIAGTGQASLEAAFRTLSDPQWRGEPLVIPPRIERRDGPAIVAEGLTRSFGDFVAVDHVSFTIARGEIFGFLGSNGCGKTTTMKMLTGLLPATAGRAELLGEPITQPRLEQRLRIGYMSQGFSLYEELSVRANLELHGKLYQIPADGIGQRVEAALARFDLADFADVLPKSLPLGIRQRLQLAAACLHEPEVLILDEPTSGVDPAARDLFWRRMVELSRDGGVTIFVSTHFMNEAERCDRISLMHAGKVIAIGAPAELIERSGAASLEDAFTGYLEKAAIEAGEEPAGVPAETADLPSPGPPQRPGLVAPLVRIAAFARRETVELLRDPIRLVFALASPMLLLFVFGYGIVFDVDRVAFAALDRDRTAASRELIEEFRSSPWFEAHPPLTGEADVGLALASGRVALVIDIPPGFGRDLARGHRPEVAFLQDGAKPFQAETARSYFENVMLDLMARSIAETPARPDEVLPFRIESRYRYNQDFRSVFAIVPGSIMLILALIPAMLTALAVVREREIGSISNFRVSPASVAEFLIGKQIPYVAVCFLSFLSLIALAVLQFGLTLKGSIPALLLGGLLYVFATSGLGLLVSSFARTQVAALVATAVIVVVPALQFSGYLSPAAALDGTGYWMGHLFPSLWFQNISLGVFAKGRSLAALAQDLAILSLFGFVFLAVASLVLKKQER